MGVTHIKPPVQKAIQDTKLVPINALQAVYVAPEPIPQPTYTGTCSDWLAQAGVVDISSASALIAGESGCNPSSVNTSSGACGVAQELPCGKSGCSLGDGACQVRWMSGYVTNRYGSWANAYATWLSRSPHWY